MTEKEQATAEQAEGAATENDLEKRRQAMVCFTPKQLLELVSGVYEVHGNPVPTGAVLVGAGWYAAKGCFVVIFEDESLPDTPVGQDLPIWRPPVIRRVKEEVGIVVAGTA